MIQLFINGNAVDHFPDETINLTVTRESALNLSYTRADFTNQFSIPGTDHNTELIQFYFYHERQTTFSFAQRIPAYIEMDGALFRDGFVTIDSSQWQFEKPSSYKITFYSNDTNISNVAEGFTLKDLPWDNYNMNHSEDIVRKGLNGAEALGPTDWQGGGEANDIIYTIIQREYEQGANPTWTPVTLEDGSIPFGNFRPSVRVSVIIDKIAEALNITINSAFFASTQFKSLYLFLEAAFDYGQNPARLIDFLTYQNDGGDTNIPIDVNTDRLNWQIAKNMNGSRSAEITFNVTVDAADTGKFFSILMFTDDAFDEIGSLTGSGTISFDKTSNQAGDVSYFRVDSSEVFTAPITISYTILGDANPNGGAYTIPIGSGTIADILLLEPGYFMNARLPAIEVSDFLRSLFVMFNLTVEAQSGTEYTIEPYNTWIDQGVTRDMSDYVDMTKAERSTLKFPQRLSWRYQPTEQVNNKAYFDINGRYYGDMIVTSNGTDSPKEYEVVSFSNMMWNGKDGNYMVGYCFDTEGNSIGATKGELGENFLHYWSEATPGAINLQGWTGGALTTYKQGSSFDGLSDPTASLNFQSEQNPWDNDIETVSLYTLYYQRYWDWITNNQTRRFEYTAYIDNGIINELRPNDYLIIGDTGFIIDAFKVDMQKRKVALSCVNNYKAVTYPLPPPDDNTPPNMGTLSIDCATNVLTWTAATDNVAVTGYKVYRNYTEINDLNALTYTDTESPSNQKNIYYIKAYDAAGNLSGPSNAIMCWGALGFDYDLNSQMS